MWCSIRDPQYQKWRVLLLFLSRLALVFGHNALAIRSGQQEQGFHLTKITKVHIDMYNKLTYEVFFFGEQSRAYLEPINIQNYKENYQVHTAGEKKNSKRWKAIQAANNYSKANNLERNSRKNEVIELCGEPTRKKSNTSKQKSIKSETNKRNTSKSKSVGKKRYHQPPKLQQLEIKEQQQPVQIIETPKPPEPQPIIEPPVVETLSAKTISNKLYILTTLLINYPNSKENSIRQIAKQIIALKMQYTPTHIQYLSTKMVELWNFAVEIMEMYQAYQSQATEFKSQYKDIIGRLIKLQFQSVKYVQKRFNIFPYADVGSAEWFKNEVSLIGRVRLGMNHLKAKALSDDMTNITAKKGMDFISSLENIKQNERLLVCDPQNKEELSNNLPVSKDQSKAE